MALWGRDGRHGTNCAPELDATADPWPARSFWRILAVTVAAMAVVLAVIVCCEVFDPGLREWLPARANHESPAWIMAFCVVMIAAVSFAFDARARQAATRDEIEPLPLVRLLLSLQFALMALVLYEKGLSLGWVAFAMTIGIADLLFVVRWTVGLDARARTMPVDDSTKRCEG